MKHPLLSIFIKAAMQDSSSVLMAETAALALAAALSKHLEHHSAHLLSDIQQLVHFPNGAELSNPPDWRIKPYTQFISPTVRFNQMADLLARQALNIMHSDQHLFSRVCTNLFMFMSALCLAHSKMYSLTL
jgi:hypothetical protein